MEYKKGRLNCWDCIHDADCEEVNKRCVANYTFDGEVVHLISKEYDKGRESKII